MKTKSCNRILFFGIFMLLCGIICFIATLNTNKSLVYAETEQQEEQVSETNESNYFREKIMPYITANISGIIGSALAILALLAKITTSIKELKKSNTTNERVLKDNEELKSQISKDSADLKKESEALKIEVVELRNNLTEALKVISQSKEMMKIAFCNTKELVVSGMAEQIAKVGNDGEENKS